MFCHAVSIRDFQQLLIYCDSILPSVPSLPEIIRTGVKDVQVYDSRSIEVVAGSKVVTISGNNVILSCPVQGFPTPSIQWRKGNVLLGEEESTLTLLDVEVNDSGQYTCTATSSLVEFYDYATTNLTVIGMCILIYCKIRLKTRQV